MAASSGSQVADEHDQIVHHKLVSRLARLRDAACEAVLWGEPEKLPNIAKALANTVPTKQAIAETGVGHLMSDTQLWQKGGDTAATFAARALREWKAAVKCQVLPTSTAPAIADRPLASMKAEKYVDCVDSLCEWLQSVDQVTPDWVCSRRLAAFLVQHGFRHWQHLDSVKPEVLKIRNPNQAALLVRAVDKGTLAGLRARRGGAGPGGDVPGREVSSSACIVPVVPTTGSAASLAGGLSQAQVEAAHKAWEEEANKLCVSLSTTPRAVIKNLAAKVPAAKAKELLEDRAKIAPCRV